MTELNSFRLNRASYEGPFQFRISKYVTDDIMAVIIVLPEEFNEHLATVSINLSAYGLYPQSETSFFVKEYRENEGMFEELVRHGVIRPVENKRVVHFGPFNLVTHEAELTNEYPDTWLEPIEF